MGAKKLNSSYYYAGGKRIALQPALDLIALDEKRLLKKGLQQLLATDAALNAVKPLRGGIRLVECDTLAPATLHFLWQAHATQPVFRREGVTLVALPEIRVEDGSPTKMREVRKFASDRVHPVVEDVEGRLTLCPLSDDGRDALALANEIVERFNPKSVSPRFIQVVPGPIMRTWLNRS